MKFISKLYFNVFKSEGNLRLLFVISCTLFMITFIALLSTSPVYIESFKALIVGPERLAALFFILYTSFWLVVVFYLPFLIILPIKFIYNGYIKERKRHKNV